MQYNGDLKNRVISKFNNATKQINSCKSVQINIPSDFEGRGIINSALTKIKAANVDAIKGEFERIAVEVEAADAKANQNAFGMEFLNGLSSFFYQKDKKDNHDVYHQVKADKDKNKDSDFLINSMIKWGKDRINEIYKTGANVADRTINYTNKVINKVEDKLYRTASNVRDYTVNTFNTLLNFNWTDVNEKAKLDNKSYELLKHNLEKNNSKNEKKQETAWDKLLQGNIEKSANYTKEANQALLKEQQRIKEETERVQASAQNELIAMLKGVYKMGEDVTDFFALRAEKLQEEHLRTIYSSNEEYKKMNKEQYEKDIEKMRNKTMTHVEKDYTEEAFNKLYETNKGLKEIDDKAYNPFKRTGVVYKAGEQVAPAIAATTVSIVAPQAASIIVPAIIGMNSAGKASEEYLKNRKYSSKEGIEQAYKDGEIDKQTYESYKQIWNLSDSDIKRITNDKNLTQEQKETILKIHNMKDEWVSEENRDNAIIYGNTIGAWDAIQYAIGMNLYKLNPTGSIIGNSTIRVGIDTGLNASDTPFKASVYSFLNDDVDFDTAFDEFGGMDAVVTSAVLGFGGSVFGEFLDFVKTKNNGVEPIDIQKAPKINEVEEIKQEATFDENMIGGETSILDIFTRKTKPKPMANDNTKINTNYSVNQKQIQEIIDNNANDAIFANMYYYTTPNGQRIIPNSYAYKNSLEQGIQLQKTYTQSYINYRQQLMEFYKLDQQSATNLLDKIIFASSQKESSKVIISAMNNYLTFYNNNKATLSKYFNEDTICIASNKIICVSSEEMQRIMVTQYKFDPNYAKGIGGFHTADGKILINIDISNTKEIAHEINHALGGLKRPDGISRGIDEAATENMALNIGGGAINSEFKENVLAYDKIMQAVKTHSYDDIELDVYYGKNEGLLAKQVDEMIGEGSYDAIRENMHIAIGGNSGLEYDEITKENARLKVDEMASQIKLQGNAESFFKKWSEYFSKKNN